MIKLIIAFMIALPTIACERDYYIISDFDDTIKSYKSDGKIDFLFQALLKKRMNAGFDVLYSEMVAQSSRGCDIGFTVLTASPNIIRYIVDSFFDKYSFPKHHLLTRDAGEDTFDYKVSSLYDEADRVDASFILIGDDTSQDANAYHAFSQENPGKVLQTYIHRIENHINHSGQIYYISAFDIAYNEYLEGRLSYDAMNRVGEAVLTAEDYQIVPDYAYCPDNFGTESLPLIALQVEERIKSICQMR